MRVRGVAFILILTALAGCGNANSGNNTKAGPSVYDAPLGSDAVLLNGTGLNPDASRANAPVAGGCLSRLTNIKGNDINCSNHPLYASQQVCQLNPYQGFANFLVEKCPTTHLIGKCVYPTHTMYYYQGYLIISPSTTTEMLSVGCTASGGSWG